MNFKEMKIRLGRPFSVAVLAGMVALAFVLGILNNLRVDEEKRVHWFGGPVVAASSDMEDE